MASETALDPPDILALSESEADRWLDRLESGVPVLPSLAAIPGAPLEEAVVFGDTHGDWRSTEFAVRRFLDDPAHRCLVGLGDYVDRAPDDCGEGSVANTLYLAGLSAAFPGRVFLIQGNHETHRRIPVLPHDLPEEVDLLWGPDERRYQRIALLLERGPLALRTESGAYLAHGGFPFPRGADRPPLEAEFDPTDEGRLLEIVWGECNASRSRRGVSRPFDEADLSEFLARSGTRIFLRGHDPDLAGRPLYSGRCLTLHTSRRYERFGGVLAARVPLDRPIADLGDVTIDHLGSEGRSYPPID
ncbi:MAG TPA: metallophosphoesterase [Thermoplasmata archaeon]|nr:metallophosphoesterase [Thermoplasmata archaeon]